MIEIGNNNNNNNANPINSLLSTMSSATVPSQTCKILRPTLLLNQASQHEVYLKPFIYLETDHALCRYLKFWLLSAMSRSEIFKHFFFYFRVIHPFALCCTGVHGNKLTLYFTTDPKLVDPRVKKAKKLPIFCCLPTTCLLPPPSSFNNCCNSRFNESQKLPQPVQRRVKLWGRVRVGNGREGITVTNLINILRS